MKKNNEKEYLDLKLSLNLDPIIYKAIIDLSDHYSNTTNKFIELAIKDYLLKNSGNKK